MEYSELKYPLVYLYLMLSAFLLLQHYVPPLGNPGRQTLFK